jgi:predicted permease
MESLLQDIRYTLRCLARSPGYTAAAIISLALGIGANTAVFTLVDRVLMRPLPVANPEELVLVMVERPRENATAYFSYPFYRALRDSGNVFSSLIARADVPMNIVAEGRVARVRGELVSGNYFDALGLAPAIGRTFNAREDVTPGSHAVAVLSHGFWQRTFGSSQGIVGKKIEVNNVPFTVVGVAPRGFSGTEIGFPTDLWIPMMMQAEIGKDLLKDPVTSWVEIMGRLKPGVSSEQASAAVSVESKRYAQTVEVYLAETSSTPATAEHLLRNLEEQRTSLVPGDKGNSPVREQIAPALTILLVITWLALAVACSNVGNLLLARWADRAKEVSVRRALGAGPRRLTRQFMVESLVLSVLGGVAGLAIAAWTARLLVTFQSESAAVDTSLDLRVLAYAFAAWIIVGLMLSLVPILASRRVGLSQILNSYSGSHANRGGLRPRDALIVTQMTLSIIMLISTGLLLQSLRSLRSVDPGFRADDLLLVSVDPGSAGYNEHRVREFWEETIERVRAIPGAQAVTLARMAPLAPRRQRQPIWVDGFNMESQEFIEIDSNFVGPQYFRTLGIPLLQGRDLDERDRTTSPPVVVVNEAFAKMVWPNQNPVGKRMRVGRPESPLREVVAVVKDGKYRSLRDEPAPMLYLPVLQTSSTDMMTIHVRSASDPEAMTAAVRNEIAAIDPNLPLFEVRTLEEQLQTSLSQTRQAAVLAGGFGLLALILSAIGVYGLTSFAVTTQTRDIGMRLALGASRSHIAWFVARRGLTLLAIGLTLGVMCSLAFTRIFGSLLYDIGVGDGFTFAAMTALLALVSVVAIFMPTRNALKLNPANAIRHQ